MHPRNLGVALLLGWVIAGTAGPARAAVVLTFDLEEPTLVGSSALFDIALSFVGDPGDTIDAIQLSILGSDPSLTAGGTDFSRFAFSIDTAALPGFSELAPLSNSGVGLLAVLDPLGPFLTPTAGPIHIGTLSVDLAGLPAGTTFVASLGGAPGGLGTDAGGIVDGVAIASFAADTSGAASIVLTDPDGVAVVTAVPEIGSLTMVGVSALCLLGFAWSRRPRA